MMLWRGRRSGRRSTLCKTMLVHPNIMNISLFSTQNFARNQTIQDVCTEPNNIKKNSVFTTVWWPNSLSQKFILQVKANITTWFYLSFSRITRYTLLLLASPLQLQQYYSKPVKLMAIMIGFSMKPNTLCFVVSIPILNRILLL